jgi:catechol 2,3-dioxygenase-like lactoylglutathione lyase family enzyme
MHQQHVVFDRITRAIAQVAVVFALAFWPPTPIEAQSQTPPLAGIAHVAIRVHDLTTTRDFYAKLGFQEAFNLAKDGVVYESFIKINDNQFIELYPATAKDPKIGFLHLCFEGDDLNAIHDDYVSRGLAPTAVRKAGAGNLLFTMVGPELQNIEYTQYMPGSLHSNDRGKHVGEDRVADRLVSVSLVMQDTRGAQDFYINKLAFRPIVGASMFLSMPGDSGQKVEIAADSLGARARIVLDTKRFSEAAGLLEKQGVAPTKVKDGLAVMDPDGNIILIEARR